MLGQAAADDTWNPGVQESGALVAAIVSATQVRRRYQFFVWTQAQLQEILPHRVLVCGVTRGSGASMFFDHFYNVPIHQATLARLCHPRQGIIAELAEFWRAGGCEPMRVTRGDGMDGISRLGNELHGLELGDAVLHGIPSEHHASGAHGVVAIVSLLKPPEAREERLMQALVPVVFGAYCRALVRDDASAAAQMESHSGDSALSEREVEILRWVRDGKSNQEIGAILSISPLTVKNHMQRILRKLQASNRTQAVSKAISMKLLGSRSVAVGYGDRVLPAA
jgi:transcriptional regulator EpsA